MARVQVEVERPLVVIKDRRHALEMASLEWDLREDRLHLRS